MLTQDTVIEKTWDDDRLRVDRLAKLQAAMREREVGALLLKDWVNALYAINTRIPSGQTFVPAEGKPIAFTRPMDDGYVSMVGVETRPTIYLGNPSHDRDGEGKRRWAAAISDLMVETGVGGRSLGVDALDPEGTVALHEAGLKLMNARTILQAAASVKTQDEVLIYWQTGKIYDRVMRQFRDELQPGVSERQMCNFIHSQVVSMGGEGLLQINVCSGENTWPWRRWPTERRFQQGDLVGMDLHVHGPGGYVFDASRTYLCGEVGNEQQRELYRRAVDYNNACIGLLKPGLPIPEFVERLPRVPEKYQEAVYSFHIIHSNELTPGEYPNVEKRHKVVDDVFKENQVLSLDCYFGERGSRSTAPYRMAGPPPCCRSSAASPTALKRATTSATVSPNRQPAAWAASVYRAPAATASNALARATRSARSLPARLTRSNSARSWAVSARSGSFCRRVTLRRLPAHLPLVTGWHTVNHRIGPHTLYGKICGGFVMAASVLADPLV